MLSIVSKRGRKRGVLNKNSKSREILEDSETTFAMEQSVNVSFPPISTFARFLIVVRIIDVELLTISIAFVVVVQIQSLPMVLSTR